MISPEQCRMARAALRWSAQELAQRANVGRVTVQRLESGKVEPVPAIAAAIRQALERAGVEFHPNGSVRLREPADAEL
jgi:transcriptional regulator with XRE-family HTH domain